MIKTLDSVIATKAKHDIGELEVITPSNNIVSFNYTVRQLGQGILDLWWLLERLSVMNTTQVESSLLDLFSAKSFNSPHGRSTQVMQFHIRKLIKSAYRCD